ncbi:MAG: outer membrane protein assembly factor BamA [Alphaproteobacteria bacterium]
MGPNSARAKVAPWRLLAVLVTWLVVALPGMALAQGGPVVREVRIEGNQRIEVDSIAAYLTLKAGDRFDGSQMDKSLKALFDTGLFTDVTLRREGDALVVRVVENPIINRIAFEGNKKVSDEALQSEVQLRPRVVYTRTKVQNDVKRLLEVYRRSGRFAATVEPKVIPLPQNRVDLVFEINEGAVTGVHRITFVGNRVFDSDRLRETIQTVETRWWRLLSTDDTYDPDRLNFDKDQLRRFYLANGYADFRVASAVAELLPDRDGFYVTFTVEEGERYKFGPLRITSTLRNLEGEQLRALVRGKESEWYNADDVEGTVSAITDFAGTLGYAFVDVRPVVSREREAKTIGVTYEVREGPKVFVERINIVGNSRTTDKVIRREFQLVEGDAFNTAKMRRSQQRLRNLNFFETVDVANVPGTEADKTQVNVQVKEKSTGELSLGAGFSSTEGAIGSFGIRERNLMGNGQDLKGTFTISQRTQEIDAGFTEPYFLDRNLAAGADLFRVKRFRSDETGYDERQTGGRLRLGYEIVDPWSQELHYLFSADKIEGVNSTTPRFIRSQKPSGTTSEVGQALLYDQRDNRLDPTDGYFARLSTDIAGLGGTSKFLRNRIEGGVYTPLGGDWTLTNTAEARWIENFNDDALRSNQRLFLGGDSLRGFAVAGVGPRDLSSGFALGGTYTVAGTSELSFPLGLPKEFGVLGKIFADVGTIGANDIKGGAFFDEPSIRAAIGFGLGWRSPFGPIRIDLARAVLKEAPDKTETFRISFGTRF